MMRRTIAILSLIGTGLALLATAALLLIRAVADISIIGGIGLPTLLFLFLHTSGGLCVIATILGMLALLSALITVLMTKPRRPHI